MFWKIKKRWINFFVKDANKHYGYLTAIVLYFGMVCGWVLNGSGCV